MLKRYIISIYSTSDLSSAWSLRAQAQHQFTNSLADTPRLLIDAAIMQMLGVNTIRVYNLDPLLNHDDCASIVGTPLAVENKEDSIVERNSRD